MSGRHGRIGVACPRHGLARANCPCPPCVDYRTQLEFWNAALARGGNPVVGRTAQGWKHPPRTTTTP